MRALARSTAAGMAIPASYSPPQATGTDESSIEWAVAEALIELGEDADPSSVVQAVYAKRAIRLDVKNAAVVMSRVIERSRTPPGPDQPPPENARKRFSVFDWEGAYTRGVLTLRPELLPAAEVLARAVVPLDGKGTSKFGESQPDGQERIASSRGADAAGPQVSVDAPMRSPRTGKARKKSRLPSRSKMM